MNPVMIFKKEQRWLTLLALLTLVALFAATPAVQAQSYRDCPPPWDAANYGSPLNLKRCNLDSADGLSSANLINANISEASMWYINLSGADLSGANLTDTELPFANLDDADLSNATLSYAQVGNTSLKRVDLSGAILRSTVLFEANLTGANLTNADLTRYSDLTNANLTDANLTRANLTDANLTGANVTGVIWSNTTCPDGSNSSANNPEACDITAPVITPNVSGTLGNNGWYVSDVEVSWTVSDGESAISSSSGCDNTTVTSDTAGTTLTCEATSAGGTRTKRVTIKRDTTAPTTSASTSPAANANGWHNSDVTVSFSGSDNFSGIASCDSDVTLSSEGTGLSASGTCTDKAGNVSATVTVSGINIDKTAPTASATVSPAANANGWHNTDVTVSISGSDNLSGIATCGPNVIFNSEGTGFSNSGTCTDNAGNVSATATASGINIDKTAPVVSVTGVVDGATYILGDVPTAGCDTQDAISGVATAAILGLSGANSDGSGTITATCAGAADNAGNSGSASLSYIVITPQQATSNVQADIQSLVDSGTLKPGQANGLTKPLDNAIRSLDKGKTADACNQLQDFISEVNAETPESLDAATAADLIAEAEAIQAAIGCP